MFQIGKKQYIFKLSTGKVLNLFSKQNSGIFLSVMDEKGLWHTHDAITKYAVPDFSACLDPQDRIHLIYQDNNGNIIYALYNNTVEDLPVLTDKSRQVPARYLNIIYTEQAIYLFYVLEHMRNKVLYMQTFKESGKLFDPKVVDYIKSGLTYHSLYQNGILYIFYALAEAGRIQPGFRTFSTFSEQWSEFLPAKIGSKLLEGDILSVTKDDGNNIFISFQRISSQKYELSVIRMNSDSGLWENEWVLASSPFSFYNSSLLFMKDRLLSYWIRENNIYYCISSDSGKTWSRPEKYTFFDGTPFYSIKYVSNMPDEFDGIHVNELPGKFTDGYKIAFLNDSFPKNEEAAVGVHSPDYSKASAQSEDISEVKKQLKEMKEKFEALSQMQQAAESRTNDCSNTVSSIIEDISAIKNDIEVFKDYISKNTNTACNISRQNGGESNDGRDIAAAEQYGSEVLKSSESTPVMPGAGFNGITPEYLRNLKKNKPKGLIEDKYLQMLLQKE